MADTVMASLTMAVTDVEHMAAAQVPGIYHNGEINVSDLKFPSK